MPAYLAYFTRDYDIPPIPATLKATYDDDAVLHDPGDTFADIEPGSEVLFYQPRVGVVGAGTRRKTPCAAGLHSTATPAAWTRA